MADRHFSDRYGSDRRRSDRFELRRGARVPDPLRVARCLRAPELGPRILFFTGGTALAKLSRKLKAYTHNSIHLVTPFDSGGSSAEIRRAFGMLSVGDLRSRLLALADETLRGNPEIYALFSYRLPGDASREALRGELDSMLSGEHPLVQLVPEPLRQIVRTHLRSFHRRMPEDFDLRRASVGNLVLTGGYLDNERDIEAVVFLFSQLVEVRGLVQPVVANDVHLRARLASGEVRVGQHLLTGKEVAPIASPIDSLELVCNLERPEAVEVEALEEVRDLIREAELICFPMGSFYTSVVANLLPAGVGRAIAQAACPKVYVPNMGKDPEQLGMTLGSSVERLLEVVRRDAGEDTPAQDILNFVAVDAEQGSYELPFDRARVKELGVELLEVSLVRDNGWPLIDADSLTEMLLSLV